MPIRRRALAPAVAAFAAALCVGTGAAAGAPSQAAAPDQGDGARLFEARCATCHGSDGRGAERGPDIVTTPRTVTRPLADLVRIVIEGVPGGGMPPTGLADDEAGLLAAHVRGMAEAAREPITYERVKAISRDGSSIEGLLLSEHAFDIHLLEPQGTLARLMRTDVSRIDHLGRERMPTLVPRQATEAPQTGDWTTYNGDVGGNRHSTLDQITPANVAALRPAWTFAVPGARNLRTTPVVVDGVMYVTAPNEVYALDAVNGHDIWRYRRPRTQGVIGDAGAGVNRGAAVQGDRLFFVTDHAHLVALHRGNGQVLWDVEMADYRAHYGATSAPLVVGNLVISGVSGGDEGVRGFVAAFDLFTGREVWRFWTVPAPGEPGSETWQGKAIAHPCAATWLTGSYDAEFDTVLWTTGNPCPDYNGDERRGDNLWSNSVVALDPGTGRLRWHFQFTPHDVNDWDAVQTVILAEIEFEGAPRKVLIQANRNGFFYVLDRQTGQLLLARPFIRNLNWATGVDADGRPIRVPGMEPSVRGTVVCPSVVGATNWMAPAFNPATGLYYVMALERCTIFLKSPRWFEQGESFYGGSTRNVPGETGGKVLRAIDVATGNVAWESPQVGTGESWSGVLSTTTGLVFFGDDSGSFAAVDARTGSPLWHFPANVLWRASPMTYHTEGRQHVAIAGGGTIYAFALAHDHADVAKEQ